MTLEDINKHIGKHICLVIPLHRRTTVAIWGDLSSDEDPLTNEIMFNVSYRDEIARFPLNDIHAVEISEKYGIVIRLTN